VSDLGEITPCWTITFHRTSKHRPERVWAAITEPDQVSRWWGRGPARIDLRVGGEYFVDFGGGDALDGVIVRLEPGRMLSYVWNLSVIEWVIEPDGGASRFTFVDNGNRPPPEGAAWSSEGVAAGYHEGMDWLEGMLDGGQERPQGAAWESLQTSYRPLIDAVLGRVR
jgi:uncharacterized protein YndB with AHSA1/START domain